MTKRVLLSLGFIFSIIVLSSAISVPLVWNSKENTANAFSSFALTEPSISLSKISDVTKTLQKNSSSLSPNYAEFKVNAQISNKLVNVNPVYNWFMISKDINNNNVNVPIKFDNNIYSLGQGANVLLVNVDNLSSSQPLTTNIVNQYFCEVSYHGAITKYSNIAVLNLTILSVSINIIDQPQNISNAKESQSLSVVANILDSDGVIIDGAISYQWYQVTNNINTPVANGNDSTLVVNFTSNELLANTIKSYFCKLSYQSISINSSVAVVSPILQTISINAQPQSTTVNNDKIATLTVNASLNNQLPGQNLSYQWYIISDTQPIAIVGQSANTLNLTFTNDQMNKSSIYYYFCRVIYGSKSIDSNTASVTIKAPEINILTQPQGFTYSNPWHLSVIASISNTINGENISYQWYEKVNDNNQILVNQTKSLLEVSYKPVELATPGERKYFCRIFYNGLFVDSLVATIFVGGSSINITGQPQDINVANSNSRLTTIASVNNQVEGLELSYQWYQVINGSNKILDKQTNNVFNLNYTQEQLNTPAVNQYFCKITYGNITQDTNIVTVRVVANSVIESVISSFNSKQLSEKLSAYKSLFYSNNIANINSEISNFSNSNTLINQTLNNINFTNDQLNNLKNAMISNPIIIGSNGNILFTFDTINSWSSYFSYQNTNQRSTICNFFKILTSQISNLNIIYENSFFGISVTLNSPTINGLEFAIFGAQAPKFYYKQTVIYTGALSNTFNNLIKTNLLQL